MVTEIEKIYHHHVPRFYLRTWATDERIWWSGYGKIICSELTVVGGQNYFYRLEELSERDRFLLGELMKMLAYGSQGANRQFLNAFTLPPILRKNLLLLHPEQEIGNETVAEQIRHLDREISNKAEDYHTDIENRFRPYLTTMLAGSVDFYDDSAKAAEFLYGLMLQYNRTKRMREAIAERQRLFDNFRGAWNVLHQMMAVTSGASFFLDRKKFKIVLIDNDTAEPFITGDQPIINLHGDPTTPDAPEQMELYYPLSPTKAMLYLDQSNPLHAVRRSVTMEEAHRFNKWIVAYRYRQLFAASEDSLKMIECNV